jgi:SAM-dependent methyltransferase
MSDSKQPRHYEKQHRGTQEAYEAYFAGMDASMQQKVALTTAHFPVRGRIADMGCGSGRGTYDLAALYQGLELIGVDINPVSVERASSQYRRPNLSYVVGDISEMVLPAQSLDGILDSSVLHHVTSFNNFDVNRVLLTLDNQVAQLKTGGVIIIRDFVIPDGPEKVLLELPETDGSDAGSVSELSTAALFELFARTWRSSVNPHGPVPFSRTTSRRDGFIRYELAQRAAAEFVLRKDYRADWETELIEEYTYLSQSQFEEAFRARGLRIVVSMPIWNPWIVENRFEGRFYLSDLDEKPLPFPPTNYLIVGEKVRAGDGVELSERQRRRLSEPKFLSLAAYRHRETGRVFELVERPHQTLDLVPWFEDAGQVCVFAKKDFPRPIVNACAEQASLSRSSFSGYITEPISAIVNAAEASEDVVGDILMERAGFEPEDIIKVGEPFSYYTSPGGVNERVVSRLVQVRPRRTAAVPFPNYTQFTDAGTVREMDATQVLRACHVGGMFDARLEINIYRLLGTLSLKPGPWIGAPLALTMQDSAFPSNSDATAVAPQAQAVFEPAAQSVASEFLSLHQGSFAERDCQGRILAEAQFEYVLPQQLSINTLVALPLAQTARGIFVGIEHRDLPAVQSFTGSSKIAVAAAWRLPFTVKDRSELSSFLMEAMHRDFRIPVLRSWELGGPYFPTPGVTPEIVYPFAAEIELSEGFASGLHFVHLDQLIAQLHSVEDAHLLITACRLAHALGRINYL